MRRLTVLCLTLLLLASCAAPAVTQPAPSGQFQLEKLGDISDMLLERQVVPQDYFRFLGEDARLQEDLARYNSLTAQLTLAATGSATSILSGLMEVDTERAAQLAGPVWEHMDAPELFHQMEARIAHLTLYENAVELCQSDPLLSHIIVPELGGSWGMWPSWLHSFGSASDTTNADLFQEYLDLIDALLDDLDALRDQP